MSLPPCPVRVLHVGRSLIRVVVSIALYPYTSLRSTATSSPKAFPGESRLLGDEIGSYLHLLAFFTRFFSLSY